jgi:hypothetical protein
MTPHDLYLEATRRGLRLEPAGDKLAVIPRGKCPPDFLEVLRQHKVELLDLLYHPPDSHWPSVPADALPLNPAIPHPASPDRERLIAYVLRQVGDFANPMTAWLVRRECAYYEGPGKHWDCALHAYAAARDAVCWQLRRTESEVWEFLHATEQTRTEDGRQGDLPH